MVDNEQKATGRHFITRLTRQCVITRSVSSLTSPFFCFFRHSKNRESTCRRLQHAIKTMKRNRTQDSRESITASRRKKLAKPELIEIDVKWLVNRNAMGEYFVGSLNVRLQAVRIRGIDLWLKRLSAKQSTL